MSLHCPQCNDSDDFKIWCRQNVTVSVDKNADTMDAQEGDIEWEDEDSAECCECGWEGTVKELYAKEEQDEEATT